jgi:uncharacterized repeat protein (TIGR03803 family)
MLVSLVAPLSLVSTCLAQTVKVLYNFDGTIGSNPANISLTQGQDGQLYGTTVFGGTFGLGAIFKITPAGHVTALHSFNRADGSYPGIGLTLGVDGNFYGAAQQGGTADYGVLFKMTPTGSLTILHNFSNNGSDGIFPVSPPTLASDGNFYGTTEFGGANGAGMVYKFTPAGVFTIIYNYDFTDGAGADFSPKQGGDGSLYLVAAGGGNNCGSLIKISTGGVLSNTHLFDCGAGGGGPQGSLFQGSDGNFYGSTFNGGAYFLGVLFRLSANFDYTVLNSFGSTSTTGTEPSGGVIQASNGNFFGVTFRGGAFNDGTIYEYSPAGTYTNLFAWDVNVDAEGQFIQHTKGALYGVTYEGGTSNLGTLYRLNVGLGPFIALVRSQGRSGSTAQILGQGFTGTTSVTFNGLPATSFTVVKDTYMTAVVPSGATTGKVVVTTPGGALTSNVNFRIIN